MGNASFLLSFQERASAATSTIDPILAGTRTLTEAREEDDQDFSPADQVPRTGSRSREEDDQDAINCVPTKTATREEDLQDHQALSYFVFPRS
jgi:hypothetical protein